MITTAKASRMQPLSVSVHMEKGAGGPPIDPGYIRVHVRVDVGSRRATENELARVGYFSPGGCPGGAVGSVRVDFGADGIAINTFLNSRTQNTPPCH